MPVAEVIAWLHTLPEGAMVGLAEDGECLITADSDPDGPFLEVGRVTCPKCEENMKDGHCRVCWERHCNSCDPCEGDDNDD